MMQKKKWIQKTFSALMISAIILALQPAMIAQASIEPAVTETGYISWSIDGIGTTGSGTIQVQKPAGATVRKAFVAAASSPSSITPNGALKINGSGINWDPLRTVSAAFNMSNYWADVTSIVKPIVDAATAGLIDLNIVDTGNTNEGLALIVIFDDPNQTTQNTIILMSGSQDPAGDTAAVMLANPTDKSKPGFALEMSLGIAFGYQPAPPTLGGLGQYSIIKVNDILLTSAAGGQDDAFETASNGNLTTVGGIGDSAANPTDPSSNIGNYRTDDELYNLSPFMDNGDKNINIYTQNPSNDDNIYFIGYFFGANTALVTGGTAPGILSVSPTSGSPTGGTSVVISGINLASATNVSFGDTAANLASCVLSSTSITCPIPAHTEGPASISVTTPNGTATLSDAFTYQEPTATPTPTTTASDAAQQDLPSILPVTGFPVGKITSLPAQPAFSAYNNPDMVLEIPALNLSTSIAGVPLVDGNWDISWLGSRIGYLQGSAFPTWAGNTVLTGHVWDADNTPGVFANLKQLKYGDQFKIHAFGQIYTYEVRENKMLTPEDGSNVFKHEELDWVTLLTCEGFNPAKETYTYRRIVRAVLVKVQ